MITVIDSISLAGSRAKQNDDRAGAQARLAWAIDGATDLHDAPLTGAASDAAWIAAALDAALVAHAGGAEAIREPALRALIASASGAARAAFTRFADPGAIEPWKLPIASALVLADAGEALLGLDLGDCRLFLTDAAGAAHAFGGADDAAGRESQFAADFAKSANHADGALYRTPAALDVLRDLRAKQNAHSRAAVFSLNPDCAAHARVWTLAPTRPAYALLCSDGFSALVDRYGAYDAPGLIAAAREQGLAMLGVELRAIETADATGARHPRWKRSDDATALFIRID